MSTIIVREWPSDYESLKSYLCGHFSCHQPLKSDDLVCGAIVKSGDAFQVIICRSVFEKFDEELLNVFGH